MPERFFLPDLATSLPGGTGEAVVHLDRTQSKHASRVLRLSKGAEVEVFDGRGRLGRAVVRELEREGVALAVTGWRRVPPVGPPLEVASAVPKGNRLEQMIDQLAQVGATGWRGLRAARSVVEPGAGKLERLERVAVAAARQCGRLHGLALAPVTGLEAVLAMADAAEWLLADAAGAPLPGAWVPRGPVRVLVGPEGGFSPAEREAIVAAGYRPTRFGPHVMRIETAAVAAAARCRATP